MTELPADPQRWKDGTRQTNLAERRAGETIRGWRQHAPLSDLQIARVAARVRGTRPRRGHRLVPALAAFLLGIATAASAAHLNLVPSWLGGGKRKPIVMEQHASTTVETARKYKPAGQAPVETTPPEPVEAPAAAAVPSELAGDARPAPVVVPSPAPSPTWTEPGAVSPAPASTPSLRRPPRRPAGPDLPLAPVGGNRPASSTPGVAPPALDPLPVPLPAPVAPTMPDERRGSTGNALAWAGSAPTSPMHADGAQEVAPARVAKRSGGAAKHLGEVIHLLRVVHDAKAALAALDRHSVALAEGSLGHEALILRVEALLALGRQDEVLRLLDRASLADVAASHSLLVTRGKLRAAAHRCADGIGDFDLVLAESRKPERDALAGRALCRKELGDSAGARADLERLRRELPRDPRLPELERRLQSWP